MSDLYSVSYELRESGDVYDDLIQEIKMSPGYCYLLDSTWLISTEETARQLYKRLVPFIYQNDRIVVTAVASGLHGRLPNEALEWIDEHR